ncbi:MAG: aldose 1-epimerase [Pirellulales bacterium]
MKPPACVSLTHPSGAVARVCTGFGFNCFDWRISGPRGDVQLLWQHPEFADGTQRPSGSGIPLLFPFPGRIPQATYTWQGKVYQLPARDGRGNAIHGFVHDRPWRVLEQTPTTLRGEFQASLDGPDIRTLWPADFRITARYTLEAHSLSLEIAVYNPDQTPLPCGFGAHPYFRVPVGGRDADACVVALPVRSRWELVDLLPTGRRTAVENADALQAGRPFGELQFDDVFTDLVFRNGTTTAAVHDPASGLTVTAEYDQAIRECVVYTPPHREAICIEPLTCVPGAVTLSSQTADTGLRLLAPGASFSTRMRFCATSGVGL